MAKEYGKSDTGYSGKAMPKKTTQATKGKKMKTSDLYLKDGIPCGDIGDDTYEAYDIGKGNRVGGTEMGIHNPFDNGIPDEGREDISAEVMKPEHKENVNRKVFTSIGDDETDSGAADASEIRPVNMGIHNTFGVK